MNFMPDAEAETLRGYLRAFLDKQADRGQLRQQLDTDAGFDRELWNRGANELGLQGLALPEAVGGSAAGLPTLGVVFEELGRALVCAPYLSTIGLATMALLRVGAPERYLESIAADCAVATLAWDGARPSASALHWDGSSITGTAAFVLDGADADLLLVAARGADHSITLHSVDPSAPTLTRTPLVTLDTTRRLARLEFAGTPTTVLAENAAASLDEAFDIAVLLLAAEQVGGAQAVLDMAVDYAKTRIQFDRPIGSFQAIKHKCADVLVDVELARSLVFHGLSVVAEDPAAAALESSLARSFVSDAYVAAAGVNIQVHGGIGFTWEHDAHLYLKRAKAGQTIFGSSTAHRRRAASLLGLSPQVTP
jgi:3-oxochol-4-en-24-oyl-CoA dehydrogenase